jgi:ADP-ribose pyrophosphatase YjhB (NUDIX family)
MQFQSDTLKECVVGVIPTHIPGAKTYLTLKHIKHNGRWRFPGGKPETGELLKEALIRELMEEIDIEAVNPEKLTVHHVQVDGDLWRCFFFLVTEYKGIPRIRKPHKHSELRYLNLYDLINFNSDPEYRAISLLESKAVQVVTQS